MLPHHFRVFFVSPAPAVFAMAAIGQTVAVVMGAAVGVVAGAGGVAGTGNGGAAVVAAGRAVVKAGTGNGTKAGTVNGNWSSDVPDPVAPRKRGRPDLRPDVCRQCVRLAAGKPGGTAHAPFCTRVKYARTDRP